MGKKTAVHVLRARMVSECLGNRGLRVRTFGWVTRFGGMSGCSESVHVAHNVWEEKGNKD